MKKRILVILIVFIISVILKSNLTESAVGVQAAKVEVSVMEELEKEKEVPVIVLLKDKDVETNKVLSTLSLESEDFKLKHKYNIINGFSGKVTKKGLEKLKDDPKVAGIYLDKIYHIFLDTSVPLINATKVWNLKFGNTNITGKNQAVCIIDTGIDYTHDNLGNCTNATFLNGNCSKVPGGYNFVKKNNDPMDDNGHGTHIAGIVASTHVTYKGVAPDTKLIAIKACNFDGNCTNSDVIAGIEWCTNNATKFNISMISMSFGRGLRSDYCDDKEKGLRDVINSAVAENITVVAATGNEGKTDKIAVPSCIKNVTAVAWSNDDDSINLWSNRNSITDLVAPGSLITSTYPTNTFASGSGTSMSAPHVAGAIALLRQFFKEQNGTTLTPSEIENVLKNTGKQINDSGGSNLNFSRIDVYSAILALDSVAPVINLIAPSDNAISINLLQEFNFTVTDNLNLNISCNLTVDGANVNTTIVENASLKSMRYTFLDAGNYLWNISCWDIAENKNTTETRKLTIMLITRPTIIINSPEDPFWSTDKQIIFNATVYDYMNLSNVSLFGNWDGWHLNETNSTGFNNTDYVFIKNLTSYEDGEYGWYIEACNDYGNCSYSSNRTFTIDSTHPSINLISPSDGNTSNTSNVTFYYNVTDIAIKNCSLIINDEVNETDTTITTNTIQNFSMELENGDYNWSINCTDYSGYENNSATWQLIVNYQAPSDDGGATGGGGGGTSGGGGSGRSTAKVVLCIENWQCSEWSNCSILGRKVRACTDLNKCGTTFNKPITIEPCVYVALTEEKIEEVKNVSVVEEETKPVPITGGVVRNFLLGNKIGFGLLTGIIVLILTILAIYFLKKKKTKVL